MSTGGKARSGMFTFVAVIFAVGIVIAGFYMIFMTPGEPETGQASPPAVQQNG